MNQSTYLPKPNHYYCHVPISHQWENKNWFCSSYTFSQIVAYYNYSHCIILKTTLLLKRWILLGSRCNPTVDKDEHQNLEQLQCGIWSSAGERRRTQVVMRGRYLSLLFSVDRRVIIVSRSEVRETSLFTFRHLTGTPAIVFSQRSSSATLSAA